jgi:hypothetical protein
MVSFGGNPMGNKFYHWHSPFQPNEGNPAAALTRRLADWERRLSDVERRLSLLEGGYADQARKPYGWGDQAGEPYYHRQDLTGAAGRFAPWVSTTSRIAADLTSSQTVRRTLGEAALAGIFFTATGGFLAGLGHLPWYAAPVVGATGASLTLAVLVAHNRTLLHRLVTSQAEKGKRRSEMRVQVDKAGDHSIEFLYLNSNVTREQLAEWARAVQDGASLGTHKWIGQGSLFTRGQYEDLMTELERMNYVNPSRGPVARTLNAKGRALVRALAGEG